MLQAPHRSLTRKYCATQVSARSTGTSTSGPIVAANAWSDPTPYTAIATAIASSYAVHGVSLLQRKGAWFKVRTKLLLPAVNACTTAISYA